MLEQQLSRYPSFSKLPTILQVRLMLTLVAHVTLKQLTLSAEGIAEYTLELGRLTEE